MQKCISEGTTKEGSTWMSHMAKGETDTNHPIISNPWRGQALGPQLKRVQKEGQPPSPPHLSDTILK